MNDAERESGGLERNRFTRTALADFGTVGRLRMELPTSAPAAVGRATLISTRVTACTLEYGISLLHRAGLGVDRNPGK